jgi:hypothetical protein
MLLDGLQSIGGSIYMLTITVVGVRMLLLARRTHGMPELLLGLSMLLGGLFGASLEVFVMFSLPTLEPQLAGHLLLVAKLSGGLGITLHNLFIWKVFRPDNGWGALGFGLLTGLLAVVLFGFEFSGSFATGVVQPFWFWTELVGRVAAPLWLSFEALRYWSLMRRRVRLGLGDPLLANRFLMYGLAALLGVIMMLTSVVGQTADPEGPTLVADAALFLLFGCGMGASACYALAFFPPAAYRERFAAVAG